MALLLSMMPIYLFGNLHCMGMCGPLVMLLGKSEFRHFYFLGRLLSFTCAGTLAGGFGAVIGILLHELHIPIVASFLFGGTTALLGITILLKSHYPGQDQLAKLLAPLSQKLCSSLLKEKPFSTFLFGFFTILLPCGQTLIVYSACALSGDILTGTLNGFAFALLTSPSLFLAMQARKTFSFAKKYYNHLIGWSAILVGTLACLRGLAEIGFIEHFVLNTNYHIVLY